MRRTLKGICCLLMAAMVVSAAGISRADDDKKKETEEKKIRKGRRVIVLNRDHPLTTGSHWLGVMATPVSDVLKSQLDLKNGLAVQQVVPKSAAAKAGVKKNDILLKLNGKKLDSVKALIDTVGKVGGKETTVVLLRGGSERTLKITPEKRKDGPQISRIFTPDRPFSKRELEQFGLGNGFPRRMLFFGPGLGLSEDVRVEANSDSGDEKKVNVRIEVRKKNDGPAEIVVKRNDKTWKVTEKELDKLPKDIRVQVERSLKGGRRARVIVPKLGIDVEKIRRHLQQGKRPPVPELRLDLRSLDGNHGEIHQTLKRMMEQIEKMQKQLDELKGRQNKRKRKRKEEDTASIDA